MIHEGILCCCWSGHFEANSTAFPVIRGFKTVMPLHQAIRNFWTTAAVLRRLHTFACCLKRCETTRELAKREGHQGQKG